MAVIAPFQPPPVANRPHVSPVVSSRRSSAFALLVSGLILSSGALTLWLTVSHLKTGRMATWKDLGGSVALGLGSPGLVSTAIAIYLLCRPAEQPPPSLLEPARSSEFHELPPILVPLPEPDPASPGCIKCFRVEEGLSSNSALDGDSHALPARGSNLRTNPPEDEVLKLFNRAASPRESASSSIPESPLPIETAQAPLPTPSEPPVQPAREGFPIEQMSCPYSLKTPFWERIKIVLNGPIDVRERVDLLIDLFKEINYLDRESVFSHRVAIHKLVGELNDDQQRSLGKILVEEQSELLTGGLLVKLGNRPVLMQTILERALPARPALMMIIFANGWDGYSQRDVGHLRAMIELVRPHGRRFLLQAYHGYLRSPYCRGAFARAWEEALSRDEFAVLQQSVMGSGMLQT